MSSKISVLGLAILLLISGCGYTQKTVLPQDIKSIYVRTVLNKVPVEEIYLYNPGLEMAMTKAIIRRLNKDGNLQVAASEEEADAVLETHLVRFQQEGLRFNNLERVEEFRLFIVASLVLTNAKTGEMIWEERNFSGDGEYFVSGVRSVGREEGVGRAIDRFARNVVDRIVEDW
jgi:outer membrane lipopolysaccharide assembly protein LptE/RlpB